jgi:hypothetical protein
MLYNVSNEQYHTVYHSSWCVASASYKLEQSRMQQGCSPESCNIQQESVEWSAFSYKN